MTRRGKRVFDLVASGIGLLLCAPVLLVTALAIRLDSKGPALFRQQRMGLGFRPFSLLKFRTMAVDAGGPGITCGADPRITRVGRFLRRFKLDELPQLWNVFRGHMSLVGPRPELPAYVAYYKNEYAFLLGARPGITDPSSIAYRSEAELLGTVEDPEGYYRHVLMPEKIRISAEYSSRATLLTDIGLLAQTVVACFRHGNHMSPDSPSQAVQNLAGDSVPHQSEVAR